MIRIQKRDASNDENIELNFQFYIILKKIITCTDCSFSRHRKLTYRLN